VDAIPTSILERLPAPTPIRWNYLLIVEWLAPPDQLTGYRLFEWFQKNRADVPVRYVHCSGPSELTSAIATAASRVEIDGTPILHVECHGGRDGVSGDERGNTGLISWRELGEHLRPLNLATEFDLLIVGAACEGLRGIFSVENASCAPFHAIVGFVSKVGEKSLFDGMCEFYRAITTGTDVANAVAEANRQLHEPHSEHIHSTPVARLLLNVVRRTISENLLEPGRTRLAVHRANDACRQDPSCVFEFAYEKALDGARDVTVRVLNKAWTRWFALDSIGANHRRFALDMAWLVDQIVASSAIDASRLIENSQ